MKLINFLKKNAIWILIIFFGLLYALWSVNRHNHFQTDAIDLGIFDQPMWLWSRFKVPLSTVKWNQYPGAHILGDHFHPILIIFSFLFRIWDDVRVLLLAQAVFVALAVYPIYLTANKILKSSALALSISFSYLSFIGVQSAIDYDFHETALAVLPLSLALYAVTFEKWRLYFVSFFLGLLFKEDMPLMFAGIGLFSSLKWLKDKQKGKRVIFGLLTVVLSMIYYFSVTKVFIPYFKNGEPWQYEELDPRIGETTVDLIKTFFTRPWVVFQVMFSPSLKVKTMTNYFASFGFIPFLSPFSVFMLLPNFIGRFLTDLPQRWLIRFQYSVNIVPALAYGTIFGIKSTMGKLRGLGVMWGKRFTLLLPFFIVFCSLFQTYRTNTPLFRMLDWRNYQSQDRFAINYKLLSLIPKDASVMAQSAFVPHLSHREIVYRYEDNLIDTGKPEYVLMSLDESSDPPYVK